MRVVFDANVFISAFVVRGSSAERVFLWAQQRRFGLCTSVPILTETARKLRDKFNQADADITAALKLISRASTVYKPSVRVSVLADTPDNRILECALAAAADVIVTGDRHLLKLKKYQNIPIIRLADLLRMFPKEPGWKQVSKTASALENARFSFQI
jgi:putative PIN family toxin of toxin-antitoxin system